MCRDDCKQEARSHIKPHKATTRPEPKGSLRPFIKCLGMSSQPLGRASKTGTPETCPKSSVLRCPFVEGKLANMFPKQAETNVYVACKVVHNYRLMHVSIYPSIYLSIFSFIYLSSYVYFNMWLALVFQTFAG